MRLIPLLLLAVISSLSAADDERTVRDLLSKNCLNCHSTTKHKGDLDLEKGWLHVRNKVDLGWRVKTGLLTSISKALA